MESLSASATNASPDLPGRESLDKTPCTLEYACMKAMLAMVPRSACRLMVVISLASMSSVIADGASLDVDLTASRVATGGDVQWSDAEEHLRCDVRSESSGAHISIVFRRPLPLGGKDRLESIPSLSYRDKDRFIHNPRGGLLDLATLQKPIRDHRRLTSGYHVVASKVEVMETSRGCTRTCSFCSMNHMYGRSFRTFPRERILADIDDISYKRRTRLIFIVDDNLVLDPGHVAWLCEAVIERRYKGLHFIVQADSVSLSRNEEMVRLMSQAGMKVIFLGLESASAKNLTLSRKGDIVDASRRAVDLCHKYGIIVIGGLIFGFPDDEEADIIENYRFLLALEADIPYCLILTPYPATVLRRQLLEQGLVTNPHDFTRYNGLWANVKTRHLEARQLQYLVWLHRQKIIGWWDPSRLLKQRGKVWIPVWTHALRPALKWIFDRRLAKMGWAERYRQDMDRQAGLNAFPDLG